MHCQIFNAHLVRADPFIWMKHEGGIGIDEAFRLNFNSWHVTVVVAAGFQFKVQ